MMMAITSMPSGYSGMGNGTPRIITTVTKSKINTLERAVGEMQNSKKVVVDPLMTCPVEVETADSPAIVVDDVVVATVLETTGDVFVIVVVQACIGDEELTVGNKDDITDNRIAPSNAYRTQVNVPTQSASVSFTQY